MNYLTVQKTEVNKTQSALIKAAAKRQRLVARWILTNKKLVCQWSIEDE